MEKSIKIFLSSIASIILLSCDPIYYSAHSIVNNSGHTITLLTYRRDEVYSRTSFFGLKNGETHKFEIVSGKGSGGAGLGFSADSVIIVFNDTVRLALFKPYQAPLFGAENFINNPGAWRKVKKEDRLYHYEYEFTEWHYQQALEAYRLKQQAGVIDDATIKEQ